MRYSDPLPLQLFRELAHQIHLVRCTRGDIDCMRHFESDYFTPKDNDIASAVSYWLRARKALVK